MSLPASLSPPSLFFSPHSLHRQFPLLYPFPNPKSSFFSNPFNLSPTLLRASRKNFNFSQGVDNLVDDRRNWSRTISSDFDIIGDDDDDDDDDDEEEEEEDRSLDLLVRFVENVFRKVSKRARKAVRSVLPQSIPTKLVGFSVNGVLMLAFLWVSKAFLEVICTLGTAVFVSILIIRGVWTGILYFQEIRNHRHNQLDDEHRAWTGTQPAS